METITRHSILRASEEAVSLWALSSSQYPAKHQIIQDVAASTFIETISSFSLNARRSMEVLPNNVKYSLDQARWSWHPKDEGELVKDLWEALNRIIHAKTLNIGFEELPNNVSVITGGAIVVPYVQAETDRKQMAFIDPFALSLLFYIKYSQS